MNVLGSSGDSEFTFRLLTMAMLIIILLPMGMSLMAPTAYNGSSEDEVLEGYQQFTGQTASTQVSVWPLVGIYTPFTGGSVDDEGNPLTYGYTDDGWLYGTSVKAYTPSQYRQTPQQYTVYRADDGVFRYFTDSKDYNADLQLGHKGIEYDEDDNIIYPGDLYTDVSFDVNQKSDIFFIESSRQEYDGGYFTYDYSGYRMAFAPISNYTAADADGKKVPVIASTTSLSLVWYQYYSQSGVTGNLVISGNNSGVAYLNAASILSAFNNNTNVAAFDLVFNGVTMNIYIKIDPMYTSRGDTVQQCYDEGHWSIMVTSLSVDSSAYMGTDNALNPMKMFETMVDLFTFNLDDYNVSPWIATLCSVIYVVPLYAGLISLCLGNYPLLIMVGILAAIQAVASIWPF